MIIDDKLAHLKEYGKVPLFITKARDNSMKYNALICGEGFQSYLINQIEKIESKQRAKAREKYSKDIRSVFERVFSRRSNVFSAAGSSERFDIESEDVLKRFIEKINSIKGGVSVQKYLSENIFKLSDIDPNGVILMEYDADKDLIYPTYKSSATIINYKSDGQYLKWLIIEEKDKELTKNGGLLYRIIDDQSDSLYLLKGHEITEIPERSFFHPFKKVPALILSPHQITGSEERLSFINPILPDAEKFAQMTSIDTIYEFQKGSPRHWRIGTPKSDRVNGVGNRGDEKTEGNANVSSDVTDIHIVPPPREGDPNYLPNIAGYISPDIDYMEFARERRRIEEEKLKDTIWGTSVAQIEGIEKTATQSLIDVQPITDKLNKYSDFVNLFHDFICEMVGMYVFPSGWQKGMYKYTYGRRFIIESPDAILKRYNEARESGAPSSVLDNLLETVIIANHQGNSFLANIELRKSRIEPYKHYDLETVNNIFGSQEAQKKVLFGYWWNTLNDIERTSLSDQELNDNFKLYTNEYTISSSNQVS